jgi:hypothetical protein
VKSLVIASVLAMSGCTYDVDPDVTVHIECVAVELGSGQIVECPDANADGSLEGPIQDSFAPDIEFTPDVKSDVFDAPVVDVEPPDACLDWYYDVCLFKPSPEGSL